MLGRSQESVHHRWQQGCVGPLDPGLLLDVLLHKFDFPIDMTHSSIFLFLYHEHEKSFCRNNLFYRNPKPLTPKAQCRIRRCDRCVRERLCQAHRSQG